MMAFHEELADYEDDLVPNYEVPCGARLAALSGEQRRRGYGAYGLEVLTTRQVAEMIHRVYSHKHYGIVRAPWRLRMLIMAFEREAILMTGGMND